MSKPNSINYYRQLNSSSLQTGRNPLSGDVCSPVGNHGLMPSSPGKSKSQAHSTGSECDIQPVQVKPSPIDKMVTASTCVQTDLSKMVYSSCRSICPSSEPQSHIVHISPPRPPCLGHICSEYKLVRSHCLCLPSHSSPSQGDPKSRQTNCLIIVIAPGWPGMP